ncbi:cytochrome c oxidase subunit 7C, mitochondrial-like [Oppia nitens]|uniref:cytochrome c oxidase subunit 7C, mitochondrial-like n=1 Tax=Oppia nitens TaxID=1686743 RepID=UPI0023D99015|nr:cytochrome c oxidase subunit 7C, mitochondrial-like [Oppia nitens]
MALFARSMPSGLLAASRELTKAIVRQSHEQVVYKGQNIPFNVANYRAFAVKMTLFLAVPFAVPFIIVRYQLKKSSGQY